MAQGAAEDVGVAAFLRGAGLEPAALGGEAPEDVMQRVGELFQQMTGGLRELLQSRANLKNEFRVDRTMIGSANNNPLKFSVDNGDAIVALLTRRRGYMAGLQAVEDGLLDLRACLRSLTAIA